MGSTRLADAPSPLLWLEEAGETLRDRRRRAGISQQLLGIMTGTTQQTVSRWEQGLGAPEPLSQDALVDILGLPADLWSPAGRRPGPGGPAVRLAAVTR